MPILDNPEKRSITFPWWLPLPSRFEILSSPMNNKRNFHLHLDALCTCLGMGLET